MLLLSAYRIATSLLEGPVRRHLDRRLAAGKEDRDRLQERFGISGRSRPEGRLVWIHAASIGEAFSVLTLIEAIGARYPALSILVTTGTVSSARLLAARLPERAFHQYAPVDRPAWVARFMEFWRPDLAVWVESELWPNTLDALRRREIPAILLNARMSRKSYRGGRLAPATSRRLLGAFSLCLAQDADQAQRLERLGATDVRTIGNLKYAAKPLPVDDTTLSEMKSLVRGRPLWVAASTHEGEEESAAKIHGELAEKHPKLLTIIVPRHPSRAEEIAANLERIAAAQGIGFRRRSKGHQPDSATGIYLADTLGELGLFYRLGEIAFLGGSLVPVGGHNPIEASRLGCAVLFGPEMSNFREIASLLVEGGAASEVKDEADLSDALDQLLSHPKRAHAMGARGHGVAEEQARVLPAALKALEPWLAALDLSESGKNART